MKEVVREQILQAIQTHRDMVSEFEANWVETVAAAADAVTSALRSGRTIYTCGNGGSAADAQHIAAELLVRLSRERMALPAVALSSDNSVLTSIGNDYGYEKVFVRQVEGLVGKNDLLWAISTSGSSPNVIAAAELAKKKDAFVLAFTGRANSRLEKIADICFCADDKSTARSQEMHQLAYHIVCDLVERNFCEKLNQ
ncbi:MAG: SIS domain-containing protein [Sedimentisphaerales bacterium]|nr:SIS domain-containing protein [Sedimentisphaerales bacterium]